MRAKECCSQIQRNWMNLTCRRLSIAERLYNLAISVPHARPHVSVHCKSHSGVTIVKLTRLSTCRPI